MLIRNKWFGAMTGFGVRGDQRRILVPQYYVFITEKPINYLVSRALFCFKLRCGCYSVHISSSGMEMTSEQPTNKLKHISSCMISGGNTFCLCLARSNALVESEKSKSFINQPQYHQCLPLHLIRTSASNATCPSRRWIAYANSHKYYSNVVSS